MKNSIDYLSNTCMTMPHPITNINNVSYIKIIKFHYNLGKDRQASTLGWTVCCYFKARYLQKRSEICGKVKKSSKS